MRDRRFSRDAGVQPVLALKIKQVGVLRLLRDRLDVVGLPTRDIGAHFGRRTGAVWKTLYRLEQRGLVSRPDYDRWHITNLGLDAIHAWEKGRNEP